MTTTTWSTKPSHSGSDANFRAWGSGISVALANLGLIQTADTGQINWTTVTRPSDAATNAYGGYEIWRFNDSLQGTYPLYFKIEYGNSVPNAGYPGIRITAGAGADGSGSITGKIADLVTAGAGQSASTATSYGVSTASGFAICVTPSLTAQLSFSIERSLNTGGNPTGAGFGLARSQNASTVSPSFGAYKYDPTTLSYITGYCPSPLWSSYSGSSVTTGTSVSPDGVTGIIVPVLYSCPGVSPWLSALLAMTHPGDTGASSVMTTALYGSSATFRGFSYLNGGGIPVTVPGSTPAPSTTTPAAIRWE